MERLMLLDGFGLVYRGYYALPPLTTSKGDLVNGVFGFCSIVLRGVADLKPDYIAVAFDLSGPTFRHEQYADYKATRTKMPDDLADQFPKVREVVKALRIPSYELKGYEADDVIGALTLQAEEKGLETTIVTVDLDMLQLVTDKTRLMTTRSGVENTVIYDPAKIADRYGLVAGQMIDFKALKGDPTDNIPGVPGVGEKTAAKLVAQFGNIDSLFERIDEVTPEKLREKLREHHDQVFAGRELSRIVRELPVALDLDAARLGDYDRETVVRLFREYEFRTLIERLPPLSGERAEEAVEALRAETADGSFPAARVAGRLEGWGPGDRRPSTAGAGAGQNVLAEGSGLQLSLDFEAVSHASADGNGTSPGSSDALPTGDPRVTLAAAIADPGRIGRVEGAEIDATREWVAAQPAVGVSLLLDDPRPRKGTPLGMAVAGTDGRVVAVAGEDDVRRLRALLADTQTPLVGHEVKPLLVAGFADDPAAEPLPVAFDTQIAAYILNAALRSQSIADVVAEQVDLILPAAADLTPTARTGLEALSVVAVRPILEAALAAQKLDRPFHEIELPVVPVLARLEATGGALGL